MKKCAENKVNKSDKNARIDRLCVVGILTVVRRFKQLLSEL